MTAHSIMAEAEEPARSRRFDRRRQSQQVLHNSSYVRPMKHYEIRFRLLARYPGSMPAEPVMSAEELFQRVRNAPPPTDDDVTMLWDGRRLDSKEKVLEWLAEIEAARGDEATAAPDAQA